MGNHCITQEKEYIDLAGNKFNSDGHASYRESVLSAGYVEDHATRVLVARGRELDEQMLMVSDLVNIPFSKIVTKILNIEVALLVV